MDDTPYTPGLLKRLPEAPRKVALLRASRIGDFLCATPAFRALREALPEAQISIITLPLLQDLVERSPYLDRFIPFPGFPGLAEQFFDARCSLQFFQRMQDERFDLAIQMQGSGVYTNPFMLLLGARVTAGFIRAEDTAGRLQAALPFPQGADMHEIERVLTLTEFLGAPTQGNEIEFPLLHEDHLHAERLLAKLTPPLIGLHPSARDATRRWFPQRFAEAARLFQRRYGGTILIFGDSEARELNTYVTQRVEGPCVDFTGQLSLPLLGGIIARLSVLVTNDTGPAHIAYALNAPTVVIFGGGSPLNNGPVHRGPFRVLAHQIPCRPCGYTTCPIGYQCLEGIDSEQVLAAIESVMH